MKVRHRLALVVMVAFLLAGLLPGLISGSSSSYDIKCGPWWNHGAAINTDVINDELDKGNLENAQNLLDISKTVLGQCDDVANNHLLVSIGIWLLALLVPGAILFVAAGRSRDGTSEVRRG